MSDGRKVCLIVIYNHNYERNIPIIRRVYEKRFSRVYHVMPFYRGADPDVIGVYENSYQFSGYVAQAASRFVDSSFSHYFFVADDVMLPPDINEDNIYDRMHLDEHTGFLPIIRPIDAEALVKWPFAIATYMHFLSGGNACEWQRFLPAADDAQRVLEKHGVGFEWAVTMRQFKMAQHLVRPVCASPYLCQRIPFLGWIVNLFGAFKSGEKAYPLVHGFSDVMAVPADAIAQFVHMCGVFAAARVFVEVAMPMSLLFSCDKVVTLKDLGLRGVDGNKGADDRMQVGERYGFDYRRLQDGYPKNCLFVHPVKLSKWKNLP